MFLKICFIVVALGAFASAFSMGPNEDIVRQSEIRISNNVYHAYDGSDDNAFKNALAYRLFDSNNYASLFRQAINQGSHLVTAELNAWVQKKRFQQTSECDWVIINLGEDLGKARNLTEADWCADAAAVEIVKIADEVVAAIETEEFLEVLVAAETLDYFVAVYVPQVKQCSADLAPSGIAYFEQLKEERKAEIEKCQIKPLENL